LSFGCSLATPNRRGALRAGGTPVALVTNSFGRDCYEGFDLHALADRDGSLRPPR
jgi:hypothetical protein